MGGVNDVLEIFLSLRNTGGIEHSVNLTLHHFERFTEDASRHQVSGVVREQLGQEPTAVLVSQTPLVFREEVFMLFGTFEIDGDSSISELLELHPLSQIFDSLCRKLEVFFKRSSILFIHPAVLVPQSVVAVVDTTVSDDIGAAVNVDIVIDIAIVVLKDWDLNITFGKG